MGYIRPQSPSRVGRRIDQRGSEGDRRLRPSPLQSIPDTGVERARPGSNHHSGHRPKPALAADLARWLAGPQSQPFGGLPASVTVNSSTNAGGERIHIIHNWSWDPVHLTLAKEMTDILSEGGVLVQDLELGPWDVRALTD